MTAIFVMTVELLQVSQGWKSCQAKMLSSML